MKNLSIKQIKAVSVILGMLLSSAVSQADFKATGASLQTATLTANKTSGTAPLLVNFSVQVGPGSDTGWASEGYILDFGDGQSTQGSNSGNVSHVYNNAGEYTATLVYTREEDIGVAMPECRPQQAADNANISVQSAEPIRFVGTDSNWFNPNNWDQGRIPGEEDDVIIAGDFTVIIDPELSPAAETRGGGARIAFANLNLDGNATLELRAGTELRAAQVRIFDGAYINSQGSVLVVDQLNYEGPEECPPPCPPDVEDCKPRGFKFNPSAVRVFNGTGIPGAPVHFYLGGAEPASTGVDNIPTPDVVVSTGPGFYANIDTETANIDGSCLELELLYDFVPEPGDRFEIIRATESLTGRLQGLEDGDEVECFDGVSLRVRYWELVVVIEAEHGCEPLSFLGGTNSNWFDPSNWSTGRVPGPLDRVEIPVNASVEIEDATVSVEDIEVNGDLNLVSSCLEVGGSVGGSERVAKQPSALRPIYLSTNGGSTRLNPSCLLTDVAELAGHRLTLGIAGTTPASPGNVGSGHYANIRAEQISLLNTTLHIELLHGFVPEAGDEFVIVEASKSLTGTFANVAEGEILSTAVGIDLVLNYIGNSIVLTAQSTAPLSYIGTNSNWFDPANWSTGRVPGEGDSVEIDGDQTVIIDPALDPRDGKVSLQDFHIGGNAVVETRQGTEISVENLQIESTGGLALMSSVLDARLSNIRLNEPIPPDAESSRTGNCRWCSIYGNPSLLSFETASFENVAIGLLLGGSSPATEENQGPGFFANVRSNSISLVNSSLEVGLIYDFEPQPGDEFVIVEASELLTGTFSNFSEGDVVLNTGGIQLVITYEGNQIVLTAQTAELLSFLGTDSNWFNPQNWEGGRVPGEGDSVEIPEGTVVRIEDADIGVSKIDLFGELELVNSCFESELAGWGYASSAVRLNPSCFVANEIENGGLGQILIVGLGGVEPAVQGALGAGHYANVRSRTANVENTILTINLIYDFVPSEGDAFVIVEAEDALAGRFSYLNEEGTLSELEDNGVIMTFDELEIAIEYQPKRAILHCRKIGKPEDF